jgi:unspecific monooxygenase
MPPGRDLHVRPDGQRNARARTSTLALVIPTLPHHPFDLADPDLIRDPYPFFAHVREELPIFYEPRLGKVVVSRYADIAAILRSKRFGTSILHVLSRDELGWPPPDPRQAAFDRFESNHLLSNEPPKHTRLRTLVGKTFTPRRIEALVDRTTAIVEETLARVAAQPTFDLVADVAEPLPVILICELLGVGIEHAAQLRAWSAAIVKLYELESTPEQQRAANDAVIAFSAFVREIVAARRIAPTDDLISALAAVEEAGDNLSEDELIGTCILLLNAGHEATVNGTVNGIVALLREPGAWERFRAIAARPAGDPAIRLAIEELLRFDSPTPVFERWVLEPTEVGGVLLEPGMRVVLLYASGNRDPRAFASPDALDFTRDPNQHLAFGLGIHYCLGAPLARLELQIALPALARRFPHLHRAEPDAPLEFTGLVIHGIKRLLLAHER